MKKKAVKPICPNCEAENPRIAGRNEYKAPGKWAVEKDLSKYMLLRAYWTCLECNTQFAVIYEAIEIYKKPET